MKTHIALLVAITLCVSTAALADRNHKDMGDHYFNKIDTNDDGVVTRREHDAFSDKMFDECDTNGDGSISREEMRAHKHKHKDHADTSEGPDTSNETKTNKGAMNDRRSE